MLLKFERWRAAVLRGTVFFFLAGAVAFAQSPSPAERIQKCASCHGEDGNSKIANIPSLAGQPEFFVLNQLFLMREGVRRIDAMMPFVKDLKDSDIDAIAKHFARLEPKAADEKIDPALVQRGSELAVTLRCASCHLKDLAGRDQMPRLARQRVDYLIHSMKEFRDNKRAGADTFMSNVVAGVSDADLTALAHYAASR